MVPFDFIRPAEAVLRPEPRTGPDWCHEIKFDGWRVQAHKRDGKVTLYSRRGNDVTYRFPSIVKAVGSLPCSGATIDAEATAQTDKGFPDFDAIMSGAGHGPST